MDPSNLKGNYVFTSLLFWYWSSLIDAFMFKWYEMSTFLGHLSLQGLGFSILYLAKSSYHSVHFASSKKKMCSYFLPNDVFPLYSTNSLIKEKCHNVILVGI